MTIENIVATTGKYTNKQGEEKNNYLIIGKLFTKDNGQQRIKIESIPTGRNGIASVYPVKKEEPKESDDVSQDLPF